VNPEPSPPISRRYLELQLPERFELQVLGPRGTWIEEGVFAPSQFSRQPNGSYLGSADGSPTWLRCVTRHDGYFVHQDGGGHLFAYRIVPRELPLDV
jgi:hypothetical protein